MKHTYVAEWLKNATSKSSLQILLATREKILDNKKVQKISSAADAWTQRAHVL